MIPKNKPNRNATSQNTGSLEGAAEEERDTEGNFTTTSGQGPTDQGVETPNENRSAELH